MYPGDISGYLPSSQNFPIPDLPSGRGLTEGRGWAQGGLPVKLARKETGQ